MGSYVNADADTGPLGSLPAEVPTDARADAGAEADAAAEADAGAEAETDAKAGPQADAGAKVDADALLPAMAWTELAAYTARRSGHGPTLSATTEGCRHECHLKVTLMHG